jgi:site-specific DNA-methyltransferase (adenine-specific)
MTTCTLINADCLEAMRDIPDGSVDMVMTDPPYGTTACKWDSVIPFEPMWEQLKRITKPNGAIVLTASQPFTSALIMSNVKMFKYCWVYQKTLGTNPMLTKKQPFRKHEDVCVFYNKQPLYNPQMEVGASYTDVARESGLDAINKGTRGQKKAITNVGTRYPSSVQKFSNGNNGNIHPTQKPVALMEYLIRTYTNECETVLDFTMGSGTTGVACKNLDRSFIGIEMDADYFANASERINGVLI